MLSFISFSLYPPSLPVSQPRGPDLLTHGLQPLQWRFCADPVRFMGCGSGAEGFLSVHHSGRVRFYHPDGGPRDTPPLSVPYEGLTRTPLPDRLVGWGPGASLVLLDPQLNPLSHGQDPLDIRACQVQVNQVNQVN